MTGAVSLREVAEAERGLIGSYPRSPSAYGSGTGKLGASGASIGSYRGIAVLGLYDPWPIHSSPPTYVSFFHKGTVTFSSSIASCTPRARRRDGARRPR